MTRVHRQESQTRDYEVRVKDKKVELVIDKTPLAQLEVDLGLAPTNLEAAELLDGLAKDHFRANPKSTQRNNIGIALSALNERFGKGAQPHLGRSTEYINKVTDGHRQAGDLDGVKLEVSEKQKTPIIMEGAKQENPLISRIHGLHGDPLEAEALIGSINTQLRNGGIEEVESAFESLGNKPQFDPNTGFRVRSYDQLGLDISLTIGLHTDKRESLARDTRQAIATARADRVAGGLVGLNYAKGSREREESLENLFYNLPENVRQNWNNANLDNIEFEEGRGRPYIALAFNGPIPQVLIGDKKADVAGMAIVFGKDSVPLIIYRKDLIQGRQVRDHEAEHVNTEIFWGKGMLRQSIQENNVNELCSRIAGNEIDADTKTTLREYIGYDLARKNKFIRETSKKLENPPHTVNTAPIYAELDAMKEEVRQYDDPPTKTALIREMEKTVDYQGRLQQDGMEKEDVIRLLRIAGSYQLFNKQIEKFKPEYLTK